MLWHLKGQSMAALWLCLLWEVAVVQVFSVWPFTNCFWFIAPICQFCPMDEMQILFRAFQSEKLSCKLAPSSVDLSQACASHGSCLCCQKERWFLELQLSLSVHWPGFQHSGSLTGPLDAKTNGQNGSQHVNENLMAVTPASTTSASEPGLMLPARDQWLLKQPMNNRSHKLGNPPCQPCSKRFAAATRFGCGRWSVGLARHDHTLCVLLVHKLDIPGEEQKSGFQILLGLDVLSLRSEFGSLLREVLTRIWHGGFTSRFYWSSQSGFSGILLGLLCWWLILSIFLE